METIHYILDNWDYLLTLTLQHLWLVALAVGMAIVIGVPLGILIVRHKWLATPVLGIATIVLTIPSIALFGLMIPLFSLIGQGIGALPAITAVFLYSAADCAQHPHGARQPATRPARSGTRHRHDLLAASALGGNPNGAAGDFWRHPHRRGDEHRRHGDCCRDWRGRSGPAAA